MVGCRRRGKELRIDVFDTGAGIPEEQRQRIFGEFYHDGGPWSDRNGGLGLGLAIVDRLARLLGHRWSSNPARAAARASPSPCRWRPAHAATETSATPLAIADPARGKRIIVIDDDALVLDGMRGILQAGAARSETAASGDAASPVSARTANRPI